jgi:hypothetical protein
MHDPDVLLFAVSVLRLDIWHREPRGHDSGEVCGRSPQRSAARIVWTARHVRHLHLRWWPVFRVRRWITDRCDACGQRFRWREVRHSYQSTDRVWHDVCMTLRHVRSDLDDITAYEMATADSNARWRVEYRLKNLDAKAAKEASDASA